MEKKTNIKDIGSGDGRLAAEDLLHTFGGGSKTRVFVSPGKDVLELLMRTVFQDEHQAVAAVILYDKCQRYKLKRGMEDLKAFLAAKCSIQGRSTNLALMAETGIIAPGVLAKDHDLRVLKRKGKTEQNGKPAEPT